MRRFQERQGMFADPEIPVGVADPRHVEFFLEVETRHHIRPAEQLVEMTRL